MNKFYGAKINLFSEGCFAHSGGLMTGDPKIIKAVFQDSTIGNI